MATIIRLKFWFGLGVVVLCGLSVFLFGALPDIRSNNRQFDELEKLAKDMEGIVKTGVKNKNWIEQQEDMRAELDEQLEEINEDIVERDKQTLEQYFDDPETGAEGPLEWIRWNLAYSRKMEQLQNRLKDSVLQVRSIDPLVVDKVSNTEVVQSLLHAREKRFWVQEAIVNCVADLNSHSKKLVPVFVSFRFVSNPDQILHPSHRSGDFSNIAFQLNVEMEFTYVAALMEALLRSDLAIELTSVDFMRPGQSGTGIGSGARRRAVPTPTGPVGPMRYYGEGSEEVIDYDLPYGMRMSGRSMPDYLETFAADKQEAAGAGKKEKKRVSLPDNLIAVRLTGYVPDYGPRKETEQEDRRRSSGRSRRRSPRRNQ